MMHHHIAAKVLVVDNYDSFTFNIVQYLFELGAEVIVRRNDEVTLDEAVEMGVSGVLLSPGPGAPVGAGVTLEFARRLSGTLPLLGVCLGHQAIAEAFGGRVVRAKKVMHGKISMVHHEGAGVFEGLPSPLRMIRYNSLVVCAETLPNDLRATAWTKDGEVMGLAHRELPVEGVQFHPESVLSEHGHEMLRRWLSSLEERG